ncbi:LLM class flavin-dependent oxidoreductase, partial [Mycolicibacterium vaccae]|nr:LLM class flavin-dependent oxidoreductase [Mycolicibacterium vaccae]
SFRPRRRPGLPARGVRRSGNSSTRTAGRMQENLPILRRLLSGENVTIDGKYNRLNDIRISPPAIQEPHPPIWVGGTAPKAIQRAADMGMHFLSGGPGSAAVDDDALRANGRDPSDFHVAATLPTMSRPRGSRPGRSRLNPCVT